MIKCATLVGISAAAIFTAMPAQAAPCPATGDVAEAQCLYSQGNSAIFNDHNLELGTALLKQALEIREKQTPAADTPEQAEQFLGLADIYHALGRNGKAEPMYRHALQILRTTKGPDSIETVPVVDRLALMLMDMGRFVEVEPGLKNSVKIIEREKGPESPDLIPALDKLSWICDAQHRPTEGASYRKRIEDIKAKAH